MTYHVTQQELEREIADWLESNPDHEAREQVERVQMSMASPGTWEIAKTVEVSDTPSETPSDVVSSET